MKVLQNILLFAMLIIVKHIEWGVLDTNSERKELKFKRTSPFVSWAPLKWAARNKLVFYIVDYNFLACNVVYLKNKYYLWYLYHILLLSLSCCGLQWSPLLNKWPSPAHFVFPKCHSRSSGAWCCSIPPFPPTSVFVSLATRL